jgi:hypothetical protein
MPFNFVNLEQKTREFMILELEYDIQHNLIYFSRRLNSSGHIRFPGLLKTTFMNGTDASLTNDLWNGCLNPNHQRTNKKTGKISFVKTTIDNALTLAEGQFNRYYIRALCRRVIEEDNSDLEIYRAKVVITPRPESQLKIGKIIDPIQYLKALRADIELINVPLAQPNSGLSVKIIPKVALV